LLTVAVVAAAIVIGYLLFSGRVQKARAACEARGGQVVIDSDARSIGQYCVLPNGTREPL
jgi:hypothetical protein